MSRRRRDNDAYYWERRGTPTTADEANLDAALDIQARFYEKPGQAHHEERGAPTADVPDLAAMEEWPPLGGPAPVVAVANGDSEPAAPVVDVGVQPEASSVAVNDSETAPEAIANLDAALDIQARFYAKSGGQAHREERGAPTADVTDLAAITWPELGESAPVAAAVNGDSERAAPVVDAGVQLEASAVAVNDSETAPEAIENQPEMELLLPAEVARDPLPEHLRGELSNVDIERLAMTDANYEIFDILSQVENDDQQPRTSLLGVELE